MGGETLRRQAAQKKLPIIGAQISTAGGFAPVPERAIALGAEVVQIFNSNPRTWHTRPHVAAEIDALTAGLNRGGLPLFFHTIYLINLASPDEQLRRGVMEAIAGLKPAWKAVKVFANGKIRVQFKDRTTKTIQPPRRRHV